MAHFKISQTDCTFFLTFIRTKCRIT